MSAWNKLEEVLERIKDLKGNSIPDTIENTFYVIEKEITILPFAETIIKLCSNYLPKEMIAPRFIVTYVAVAYWLSLMLWLYLPNRVQLGVGIGLLIYTGELWFSPLIIYALGVMFLKNRFVTTTAQGETGRVLEGIITIVLMALSVGYATGYIGLQQMAYAVGTLMFFIALVHIPQALVKKSNDMMFVILGFLAMCTTCIFGIYISSVERWHIMLVLTGKAFKYSTKTWSELYQLRSIIEDIQFQREIEEAKNYVEQGSSGYTPYEEPQETFAQFVINVVVTVVTVYRWSVIVFNHGVGPRLYKAVGERKEMMLLSTSRSSEDISKHETISWITPLTTATTIPPWVGVEIMEHMVFTALWCHYATTGFHLSVVLCSLCLSAWVWHKTSGQQWLSLGSNAHRTHKNIQGSYYTGPVNDVNMIVPTIQTDKNAVTMTLLVLQVLNLWFSDTQFNFMRTSFSLAFAVFHLCKVHYEGVEKLGENETDTIITQSSLSGKCLFPIFVIVQKWQGKKPRYTYTAGGQALSGSYITPLDGS